MTDNGLPPGAKGPFMAQLLPEVSAATMERTSTPLRVPKARARSTTGPAGSKGAFGMQWVRRDPLRMGPKLRQNRCPACQKQATNF
jgi:hypothetical protein